MLRFVPPPLFSMPRAASSTRTRSSRPTPKRKQNETGRRGALFVLRWLLTRARPRSAPELLALILVLVAVGALATVAVAAIGVRRWPGVETLWCLPILLAALAARLSPWWRLELQGMTADRARNYAGSVLLVVVASSLAWHLLATNLGWGDSYLLLGPASKAPGAILMLAVLAITAVTLILNLPLLAWTAAGVRAARRSASTIRRRRVLQSVEVDDIRPFFVEVVDTPSEASEQMNTRAPKSSGQGKRTEGTTAPVPAREGGDATRPPIDIFAAASKKQAPALDVDDIGRRIEETLASFGVRARVVDHHSGPVVTQFDVQPERGVKVKSITTLQNDLALALAAPTIRIQAPVPGKPVVGIEIPNASAATVSLRELLESEAYRSLRSPLSVVLGKDVAGNAAVIDLAKMPHLLIAGATGSGKSVCVNTLISCLLYRNTPEEVRLMMIDPKMVELTVYNGVPHLYSPVVTQMDKVVGVLQWALREMERRYQLFAANTVRNIGRFNEKMEAAGQSKLPYIVLIIDELADLMMVAPEDVEDAICRLAQLARAAGIHLVIATQRPSVDVVTGLIKANFPARIAFAMTSQVDSRTILDKVGAEKLLGRGDMLYMPPDGPSTVRLQGAFLSDQEIERLVEFWQRSPLQAAVERIKTEDFEAAEKEAGETEDELLGEAIQVVRQFQTASVTLLQRRLRVGYARAARLMDRLEAHGVVGPPDGSKQRPVLPAENPPGADPAA